MMETDSRIDGNWFREECDMWDGYSLSLKVDKVIYHDKSQYQDILVFKSTKFGNVLVLDGAIQCTERDEFAYQEMMAHLPLNTHPHPQTVLVVGGGDGGVVREVLKYETVTEVVLCEIDQKVIDVCRKYLPKMAECLDDPRVTICVDDGMAYVKNSPRAFDVIITDAPDPSGCAEGLFEKHFYQDVRTALKTNGVACFQGESTWFDLPLIKRMLQDCRSVFPKVAYGVGYTPTYAGGQMGYMLCSLDPNSKLRQPLRHFSESQLSAMNLRYYSPEVHIASFVLPRHAKKTKVVRRIPVCRLSFKTIIQVAKAT